MHRHDVPRSLALVTFSAVLAIGAPVAEASCIAWEPFGQIDPHCEGGYCYVVSPGAATAESLLGAFWSLGTGDPSPAAGDDNGTWPVQDWLHPYGDVLYLSGDWKYDSRVNGCITGRIPHGKPSEIMLLALSDQSGDGRVGHAAVAAVRRTTLTGSGAEFDFTLAGNGGAGSDIVLAEIPRAIVLSVNRTDPDTIVIDFAGVDPAEAEGLFHTDGTATLSEAIVGYRLFSSRAQVEPDRIRDEDWTVVTGMVPLTHMASIETDCREPLRYARSLVYDGGFESGHLSGSTTIECGWCTTDEDGDGWFTDLECHPDTGPDCDDRNADVHPYARELCDGLDNDCNGLIDDDADGEDSDTDRVLNACDNCTFAYNPSQSDRDGDLEGDHCDLDDAMIYVRLDTPETVGWQQEAGYERWNLYEGDLFILKSTGAYTQAPGSNPLAAKRCDLTSIEAPVPSDPGPGAIAHFLVTGAVAGIEGGLGQDSAGAERPNAHPCP